MTRETMTRDIDWRTVDWTVYGAWLIRIWNNVNRTHRCDSTAAFIYEHSYMKWHVSYKLLIYSYMNIHIWRDIVRIVATLRLFSYMNIHIWHDMYRTHCWYIQIWTFICEMTWIVLSYMNIHTWNDMYRTHCWYIHIWTFIHEMTCIVHIVDIYKYEQSYVKWRESYASLPLYGCFGGLFFFWLFFPESIFQKQKSLSGSNASKKLQPFNGNDALPLYGCFYFLQI